MSKASVGDVYDKVIKVVCEQSQVDFEEGGVDESTLKLLKSEWQKKLSGLRVTQLPWDPAPPPPTQPVLSTASDRKPPPQPAPLPSNGNPMSTPSATNTGQRVKQEPGYPTQPLASNNYPLPLPQVTQHGGARNIAEQRAALHLQQQYGARANQQINQLQQGSSRIPPQALPLQNPLKRESQEPQIKREAPEPMFKQEEKKSAMGAQAQPGLSQQYKAPVNPSQVDGSGDDMQAYRAEVARRREVIASQRGAGNGLFRQHLQESQQRLEGGGLLVPLEERYMPPAGARRHTRELEIGEGSAPTSVSRIYGMSSAQSSRARAQGDAAGDDDDEEVDEDAINSDLDDPDEIGEENNEEETDQVMLCTYDKVARVKNKWKCTLKDGILRVDGSEYVFHKGQGEFEW